MKILHFLIKNSSTLDFAAPIYHQGIKNKKINVVIFVAKYESSEILKNSLFWDKFFSENNIEVKSYIDYLKFKNKFFLNLISILFYIKEKYNLKILNLENARKRYFYVVYIYHKFIYKLLKLIELVICTYLINHDRVLKEINPDVIFFDNRGDTNIYGRNVYYEWFYKNKKKIYLLPHAPHLRDPISEFVPFDSKGEELPSFCEFWVPFKYGKPWLGSKDNNRAKFYISGYPGFDTSWLSQFRSSKSEGTLCFLMRQYVYKVDDKTDPYVLSYNETFTALKNTIKAYKNLMSNSKIIIKPHPSNNIEQIKNDLHIEGIEVCEISNEPIYEILNQADTFVGFFSTALIIPAMAGFKTIFINSSLQKTVYDQWNLLSDFYSNWPLAENNYFDIKEKLLDISTYSNIKKIRSYYDDHASLSILNRIINDG